MDDDDLEAKKKGLVMQGQESQEQQQH